MRVIRTLPVAMNPDNTKLSDLVDMESPSAVLDEAGHLLNLILPGTAPDMIARGHRFTVDLYEGRLSGYKACNTGYHDLKHATDTLLTMGRLLHGAFLNDAPLSEQIVNTCLISALLHDAGYIQHEDDIEGTGAKYTQLHVPRSMDFVSHYAPELGLSEAQIQTARMIIWCTDLSIKIDELTFESAFVEKLGRLLMAADLMSQMSDRKYLEKLLFLYHEFREANFGDYSSGRDLLIKTLGFYDYIDTLLGDTLLEADLYLTAHFTERWQIPENLYRRSIDNQKNYLKDIIHRSDYDHERYLKRGGIVKHIQQAYGTF